MISALAEQWVLASDSRTLWLSSIFTDGLNCARMGRRMLNQWNEECIPLWMLKYNLCDSMYGDVLETNPKQYQRLWSLGERQCTLSPSRAVASLTHLYSNRWLTLLGIAYLRGIWQWVYSMQNPLTNLTQDSRVCDRIHLHARWDSLYAFATAQIPGMIYCTKGDCPFSVRITV